MVGSRLVRFHREHGLEPAPRLTSNPKPPFTVEFSTRSSSVRHDQVARRVKLAGYALLATGGLWIAAQFIDLITAPLRP